MYPLSSRARPVTDRRVTSRVGSTRFVSTLVGAALALTSIAAPAQSPASAVAPVVSSAAAPAGWTKATTVFVNTVIGSRTGGSAKRLNESHAEMEAKGWRFLSLETYNENGDLVGFFVTYVR